jgi:enoyl-CoA hydratase/carnithine racemase
MRPIRSVPEGTLSCEVLFTVSSLTAEQARVWATVNEVLPLDTLRARTMSLATEITAMDPWVIRLATARSTPWVPLPHRHELRHPSPHRHAQAIA